MDTDVAIIGGGPAGSTAATLLKKYGPHLKVVVLEREVFPRDHVGESLLPPISRILAEMGVWDKIEAANFPIKIGASYRWGKRPERWDFNFLPAEHFLDEARPAPYAGQRTLTAFQVDRSIYDKVLLDHAKETGVDVRQGTKVLRVLRESDRISCLELETGERLTARYYIDASGSSGILRRALDVPCESPSTLRNIAIYDYWQNAEWAVKIGVGGTRIQVLSVGYGWLWFIPLGPTRTSIGLVVPAEYYKKTGKTPRELYDQALQDESIVASLIRKATSENKLQSTKDWSFLAEKQAGENWFLVGECAGFADPILSAGVTMAHIAAQQLAFTILELDRGKHDPVWLKDEFQRRQSQRIRTHIRFGDYWYTANAQFKELKEFTTTLAEDIGLDMSPELAWEWIARGGFIDEDLMCGAGGFSLSAIKSMGETLSSVDHESPLEKFNVFRLDLGGASWKNRADYRDGGITLSNSYVRGDKVLPLDGPYEVVLQFLQRSSDLEEIITMVRAGIERDFPDPEQRKRSMNRVIEVLEALVADGWVKAEYNPDRPLHKISYEDETIRWNTDQPATMSELLPS